MIAGATGFVRKLTASPDERRESVARRLLRVVAASVALTIAATGSAATTGEWHAPEQISAVAEAFLQKKIGASAGRTSASAQPLDPRHRLARCSKPLEPFMRQGTKITARTIVGVACKGTKPWKLYIPVNVVVTDTVLIAKRTLPRGHTLMADDFVSEQRDVSRLVRGYISDDEAITGQRLKTQMMAGSILTPAMVKADIAIRRGQTVTLTIASGGINIQMSGKALMDGALSQRIRVENTNSGRIVEGIVRSREHVEVLISKTNSFFNAKPKVSPKVADMRSSNNDR